MGCSSSALHKAGDSSRLRGGVPANECVSSAEESESCVAQPKPCALGRESAFYGKVQSKSLPPLERPKASVAPTANGVTPRHELSLVQDGAAGKDAPEQTGPTEKTGPTDLPEESELPQPGDKDDTPEIEETKRDLEAATEVQPLKGSAETEALGTEQSGSLAAGESVENQPNAGMLKPPGRAERSVPVQSAGGLPAGEAMEGDQHPPMPEAVPEENNSPEISEGCQSVETVEQRRLQETLGEDGQSQLLEAIPTGEKPPEILEESQLVENSEEQELQETLGKDEQSRLQETIPKEDAVREISDRSQLVQTPVMKESLHEIPEAPGDMEQVEPEEIAGSRENPAGATETAASVDMTRNSHADEEEQHIEGETGEKVEAEMENEKASEGAETKEQETGEVMDLSADGHGDQSTNGHSVLQ
uniref:glutamate-rich protein 5 n=1 Tax=Jaculus jaculus TaxID=51337 RepID=UPI001E1B2CAA|nr:glutamate-rich protein 5 [Jaculus jaculus]